MEPLEIINLFTLPALVLVTITQIDPRWFWFWILVIVLRALAAAAFVMSLMYWTAEIIFP